VTATSAAAASRVALAKVVWKAKADAVEAEDMLKRALAACPYDLGALMLYAELMALSASIKQLFLNRPRDSPALGSFAGGCLSSADPTA
jgi:hypothetical protein